MPGADRTATVRLRAEFGQAVAEWKKYGNAAEEASKSQEKAAKAAREAANAAEASAAKAGKAAEGKDKESAAARRYAREQEKAAQAAKQAAAAEAAAADVRRRSATTIGQASLMLEKHSEDWNRVGTSLMTTGALMVGAVALVTKAAIGWESAWAGVLKTVDTDDPMKLAQIESGLRGLAQTMPQSHAEIAAVAEAAGQLGVKADDVVDFTRVMVMLGDTTNLSSDAAATGLAQLMNVMQTAPDDVDRLGATLVGLGNAGASTEAQILDMGQRIAGSGKIVGLTEAQVLGLSNALASSGIEAQAGGSAISRVLIDIDKAVATNSKELATWAEVAGMSGRDFAAAWEADPAQALVAFTSGLGDMAANGENVFGVLDELGQMDVNVSRALLNMANAGDLLAESFATGDKAWENNSALIEEAEKRYDTTAAKAQIAWNNIKDSAISAGQAMLPVVSSVADAVSAVAQAFGAIPAPVQGALTVLAGVGGVALLAVGGAMKLASVISETSRSFQTLQTVAPGVAGGIGKVGKAAGIAAVAVAGLSVIGKVVNDHEVESTSKWVEAILNGSDAVEKLAAGGSKGLSSVINDTSNLGNAIKEADVDGFSKKLGGIMGTVGLNGFQDGIDDVKAYDQALAYLVSQGALDEAARGQRIFAAEAANVGKSAEDVERLLPGYADALRDIETQQKLAAETSTQAAEQMSALDMVLAELGGGEDAQKALDAINESTRAAAMSFLDAAVAIDPAKDSLSSWISRLEDAAKAQSEWADNMILAKTRGVDDGVLAAIQEQGPAAAGVLAELASGSEKDIDRINNAFGRGEQTAGDLASAINEIPDAQFTEFATAGAEGSIRKAAQVASKYGLVPEDVATILRAQNWAEKDIAAVLRRMRQVDQSEATTRIKAETQAALDNIFGVISALSGVRDKTVRVRTITESYTGGGSGGNSPDVERLRRAVGGAIYGPGTETSDSIPALLSNGEHVLTAAEVRRMGGHGAVYRFRESLASGSPVQRFASGGAVNSSAAYEARDDERASRLELARMEQRIIQLQRDLRSTEKYGRGDKRKRLRLRGKDRQVAQLELAEARHELAVAKRANASEKYLRRRGSSLAGEAAKARRREDKAEQDRRDAEQTAEDKRRAAEDKREEQKRALGQRTSDVQSAASGFAGRADISSFSSPERVSRNLQRTIADMDTFIGLIVELKNKGASPWLLQQLQAEGPTRGALNFARKLLTDTSTLNQLNTQAAQLGQVSNAYGAITTGWAASTPAAGFTVGSTKKVDVTVTTLDMNRLNADLARLVRQELASQAAGSGAR